MQVDTMKTELKAPGTNHLTLKHAELLSTFALKFNLRNYIETSGARTALIAAAMYGKLDSIAALVTCGATVGPDQILRDPEHSA